MILHVIRLRKTNLVNLKVSAYKKVYSFNFLRDICNDMKLLLSIRSNFEILYLVFIDFGRIK